MMERQEDARMIMDRQKNLPMLRYAMQAMGERAGDLGPYIEKVKEFLVRKGEGQYYQFELIVKEAFQKSNKPGINKWTEGKLRRHLGLFCTKYAFLVGGTEYFIHGRIRDGKAFYAIRRKEAGNAEGSFFELENRE